MPPPPPEKSKPRDPLWAKLCIILGAVIAVVSGSVVIVPKALAGWATANIDQEKFIPSEIAGKNIDGPINVLLIGMDERSGGKALIRSDTIIIAHIPATHDRVYLISIPRDTYVRIPDYPPSGFVGWSTKINAAFAYGASKDGKVDPTPEGRRRGAELLMLTINNLVPGGIQFHGAAIINFDGFLKVLEAIDGVHMCVDVETRSQHYNKDGVRKGYKYWPYSQQKVYPVGCYHMEPWEALDFSRQRNFPNGDYTRQKHQQMLLMAMLKKIASKGTLTDLNKVLELQKVAGDLLTLDLQAAPIEDWFFTLRNLRPDDLVMIKTNGGKVNPNPNGEGELLTEDSLELLQAVQQDKVFEFLTKHRDWIASAPSDPKSGEQGAEPGTDDGQ